MVGAVASAVTRLIESVAQEVLQSSRIAIVGAGSCGLACAVALARQGHQVVVLERREDPDGPAGRQLLGEAEALMAASARIPDDLGTADLTDDLAVSLDQSRRLRQRVWGTQNRNVVVDGNTIGWLSAQGVDTADLPRLEHLEIRFHFGELRLTLGGRASQSRRMPLDVNTVLTHRDWEAMVPLARVERVLRDRCEACDSIELRFGVEVQSLEERDDGVCLAGDMAPEPFALVLIADGGGRGRLVSSLGIDRRVHCEELIDFVVVRGSAGSSLLGRPADSVLGINWVTDDGWFGVFGDGDLVNATVNGIGMRSGNRQTALSMLAEQGFHGTLAEPPVRVNVQVAESSASRAGGRIAVVGDANVTGNPRAGLGVQFSVLWAQLIADCVDEATSALDLGRFDCGAERIRAERVEFELAFLQWLNAGIVKPGAVGDLNLADGVMAGMRWLRGSLRRGAEGQFILSGALQLDGACVPLDPQNPMARLLRQRGNFRVDLQAELVAASAGGVHSDWVLRSVSSSTTRIRLELGQSVMEVFGGSMLLRRQTNGWLLQVSGGTGRSENGAEVPVEFDLPVADALLPDGYLEQALGRGVEGATQVGAWPLEGSVWLRAGSIIQVGHLQCRAVGTTRLETRVERQRSLHIQVKVLTGSLVPLNFAEFARSGSIGAARALGMAEGWLAAIAEPLVNTGARLAAGLVSGYSIRLNADGSAILTLHGSVPLRVGISAAEVQGVVSEQLRLLSLGATLIAQMDCVEALQFESVAA